MNVSTHDERSVAVAPAINWAVVGLLMAICFISHLNRISMPIAGDERIMKQYALAPEKMGMVYSAFLLVYTVFMIPGGFFIDRVGPRASLAVVAFGSALFGALTGAVGVVGNSGHEVWLGLLWVRGTMGLVSTPLHPASAAAVGRWIPASQRSLVNGLITGSALLGIACTYKVFGSLIAKVDWPKAFAVTGTITAMIGVAWLMVTKGQRYIRTDAAIGGGWRSLLRNRSVLLLTVSYAAIGYFQYIFFYWTHYYFDEVLHLGKEASKYYAGIPSLVMAFSMPLGGWISDALRPALGHRRARAALPFCGMLLGAVLLGCGVGAKTPFWIVLWFALALGAVGMAEGSFWATAVEAGGKLGGTAAAIVNTGGNGGGLLAPVITPWLSGELGWPVGIGLGAIISLGGALCWLGIDPERNEDERGL